MWFLKIIFLVQNSYVFHNPKLVVIDNNKYEINSCQDVLVHALFIQGLCEWEGRKKKQQQKINLKKEFYVYFFID